MVARAWTWNSRTQPVHNVTVTNPTDRDLVAAARAGSREAFDAIVERHRRHV
jgi:hypothetical protein